MHGKRRRKSPLKGIWDSKKTTSSITKSKEDVKTDTENYQKTQKHPTGKNKKAVDAIVNAVVPDSAGEALTVIGGAGVVNWAKSTTSRLYNTAKALKTTNVLVK